jgi:hypothetical protein
MKFFSSLLKTDPFKRFAEFEKQLTALEKPRHAYRSYDEKLKAAIATAQQAFDANPTADTLAALHVAIASQHSFVATDLWKKQIEDAIFSRQSTHKRAPESLAIYTACLQAIEAELKTELSATRSKLTVAFKEAGDDAPNVDAVPATQKLIYQIEEVQNAVLRIAHPSPLSDSDILRILTLIRGQLPSPPPAKAPESKPAFPMATASNLASVGTAPATNGHRLLPPSWESLNPKVRAERGELTGHRLTPNGPVR